MSTNTLKQALEIVYGDIKNINKRVKNLESASIGVIYNETTKSAVAYQDNVSANACPYALLNKVGGMSYKSENKAKFKNSASTTINGVVREVSDNVITLNGTSTATIYTNFELENSLPIGNYGFMIKITGTITAPNNKVRFFLFETTSSPSSSVLGGYITTTTNGTITTTATTKYLRLNIEESGVVFNNVKIELMLVSGSTAPTEYQPYFDGIRDTAISSVVSKDSNNSVLAIGDIPQEIQALEGYGWGINNTCYNYIDFENKKFIQKVGRAFGSTYENNISIATTSAGLKCVVIQTDMTFVNNNTSIIVQANNLGLTSITAASQWTTTATNIIACNTSKRILINFDQSLTDEQMIAKAKTLILYYALVAPIETDISSYSPDDFNSIQIEPNGTITFDNTYQQAIPYEYLYLEKVGANNE
jgi:hypothetical protein